MVGNTPTQLHVDLQRLNALLSTMPIGVPAWDVLRNPSIVVTKPEQQLDWPEMPYQMPSFRKSMSLRPVKTLKHEDTWSNLGQNASTTQVVNLILGTESPVTAPEVDTGSIVKSIYVEFNLNGVDNSGSVQVFHWMIVKNPANLVQPTPTNYNSDTKKFTLKRGMEMLPEIPLGSGGTVQTKRIFVLKLPPRLRRFDDGDRLDLRYISSSASSVNFCGIAIFKEYK